MFSSSACTSAAVPVDDAERYTPFSTSTQMYWVRIGESVHLSPSQGELRLRSNAPLDSARLALALCANVPSALRSGSYWMGVQAASPGHTLTVSGSSVTTTPTWQVCSGQDWSVAEASGALHRSLLASIERRVADFGRVSSDLSGGMDSTSLAYLLGDLAGDAVFYHSGTVDTRNLDTQFARRAAQDIGGTLVELESFSSTTSGFVVQGEQVADDSHDGPWAWGSNASHLKGLLTDAAGRDIRAHLTGLGGDELFSPLPTLALALAQHGQTQRARRAIRAMARHQRWGTVSTFRAAASREAFPAEVVRRVKNRTAGLDGPNEAFAWAPGFAVSPFATRRSVDQVVERVETSVRAGMSPLFEDKYRHQVGEAVIFQGEVIRQMNHAFRGFGVSVEAPLIDDDIVSVVLGLHPQLSAGSALSKPLLAAAAAPLVPSWVFERADKGEYSADLFAELRAQRVALRSLFDDSYLVDNGYVDADKIRAVLEAPLVGTSDLFELEQVAGVERWARSNA